MPKMKKTSKTGEGKVYLTDEEIRQIEDLAGRLTCEQIADYFGISHRTFRDIRFERQPEADCAYKRGKAKALETVTNLLMEIIRERNLTAIMFYLKTQGGWREKEGAVDVNVDGKDSPKVTISFATDEKKEA